MSEHDMHLVEHLAELRRRIMITLAAFTLSFCAAFLYVKDIYRLLVKDVDGKLAVLGPSDIIWVYFMIAGVFAVAVTIPVAAYETWKFVKPALHENERRITLAFIPAISALFVLGLGFGYFVLFPLVLSFLTDMAADLQTFYTAEKYFRFMLHMTLPFGFLFEMPVAVMFLTRLGLLNPLRLAKARKMSYFVLVVVAVMITPPDIISDILVVVPLLFLYEISVSLSRFVYRKKLLAEAERG
jgi:sec-independent protein translocase protein TatC